MCSICGGTNHQSGIASYLWEASRDRGRDAHGKYEHPSGYWVGNHRATPTTEVEAPSENQPVGKDVKLVFNGIISNDDSLGKNSNEADTSVLPRCLDFTSLTSFRDSLAKLKGSFAIAVLVKNQIWLACNYKPIWITKHCGDYYFSSLENHFPDYVLCEKMKPYSVRNLTSGESLDLPRHQSDSALVIASGGLDSTVVASIANQKHSDLMLLHFLYGCRAEESEQQRIIKIAERLNCNAEFVKLSSEIFSSSPLLDSSKPIAEKETGAEFAYEWVPARNLIMLSMAVGYAENNGYGHIYLGTNLEEGGAYPDNEEQFILDFNNLLYGAVQNGLKIEVHTPLGGLMKHEIVKQGLLYNAPFELTWSCYKQGVKHCGECGPCFMRKTAFERNGIKDPVFKED